MATIRYDIKGLEAVLDLPEGVTITDVGWEDSDETSVVVFVVEGEYLNADGDTVALDDEILSPEYAAGDNGSVYLVGLHPE